VLLEVTRRINDYHYITEINGLIGSWWSEVIHQNGRHLLRQTKPQLLQALIVKAALFLGLADFGN
jgi:hypothetical protein